MHHKSPNFNPYISIIHSRNLILLFLLKRSCKTQIRQFLQQEPDLHSFETHQVFSWMGYWKLSNLFFRPQLKPNVNTYAALKEPYLSFDGVIGVMHLLRFTNIKSCVFSHLLICNITILHATHTISYMKSTW